MEISLVLLRRRFVTKLCLKLFKLVLFPGGGPHNHLIVFDMSKVKSDPINLNEFRFCKLFLRFPNQPTPPANKVKLFQSRLKRQRYQ